MRFFRAQGILATTLSLLAISCGRPDLRTDLRPAGPPDVTTVMLPTGELTANNGVPVEVEVATFCKANDDKVPTVIGLPDQSFLQICPEIPGDPPITTVTNADPSILRVRVVFDELLDPDVEELVDSDTGGPCTDTSITCDGTLAGTQPVNLMCNGAAVPYDGYYVPNGNLVSWPPGPALVVIPTGDVATSADCELTLLDTVVDKQGIAVPADQRGPYSFSVAPLAIILTDPEPGGADVDVDAAIAIVFNARLDSASVTLGTDVVVEDSGGAPVAGVGLDVSGNTIVVTGPLTDDNGTPADPSDDFPIWAAGDYTVTIPTGATFADVAGGTLTTTEDLVIDFTVVP